MGASGRACEPERCRRLGFGRMTFPVHASLGQRSPVSLRRSLRVTEFKEVSRFRMSSGRSWFQDDSMPRAVFLLGNRNTRATECRATIILTVFSSQMSSRLRVCAALLIEFLCSSISPRGISLAEQMTMTRLNNVTVKQISEQP